jgi:uncharacterized CHY-type Zn-finger protein
MYSESLDTEKRKGNKMAIHSLVVEIEQADGSKMTPVYECHGSSKFHEFVEWHEQNLSAGTTAVLKGFDYNTETPDVVWTIKR